MAGLHDYLKGDASTPRSPKINQDWGQIFPGPYVGIVKGNKDPLRAGRLKVLIPSLRGTYKSEFDGLIDCDYLSPFYGNKGLRHVKPGTKHTDSQFSYGFWAVPPDLETRVLVILAEGKMEQAFWIGCVQEPLTNHMTPGIASSNKVKDDLNQDPTEDYGSSNLPAGEVNRFSDVNEINYKNKNKPIHPLADILLKQGLSADDVRGNTTSSAQREAPSQVFGMSTPGRLNPGSTPQKVSTDDAEATAIVDRLSGHTFVMDDGAVDGTNQLTRLRTASGHQLLMHDTDGIVYIANGSGNAYIEMQKNGRIDVYSGVGGINLRTEGDFNLHSDSNINMHAGGQIRFSSTNEIIKSAGTYMLNLGDKGIFNSAQSGSIRDYARDGLTSFTDGQQLHGASGQIHLAGAQVHFNSTSASTTWGPKWLDTEAVGMTEREEGDVELTQKGIKPLEPFTRKTKTTVHKLVTHEPMFRASVIGNDGIIPIDSDDKKRWSQLANTPGTAEFLNNQNRLSTNSAIRDAQYQADALEYVRQKMGNSTDPKKAKSLLTDFGLKYNEIYGISGKTNLPFDIKDSVSEKIKGIDFNTPGKDLINTLSSQVVENFTGKSTELFKDNVFVNKSGELFSLGGNAVSGISSNVDLTNSALNSVQGLTKNLSVSNIPNTISNLSSITQTYSSIVGGKIVGMNQVKSLASKAGLFNARDAARLGQSFFQNVGTNIVSNIGSIAGKVGNFFSGSGIFSDNRLKQDIKLIGKSPAGVNIYEFKYKHTSGTWQGVMAQEVPWASTMTDTGFYMVDYSKVDVEFRRIH